MNKWITMTFVFVVSLVLASVPNHAVAVGDRHETPCSAIPMCRISAQFFSIPMTLLSINVWL